MANDKRRRGRRSDIDWPAIRAAFEAGETNITALSRKFRVARGPIIKHRDEEKWTVTEQAKERIREAAKSNVISIATRKAVEKLGGEAGIQREAEAIAAELLAQRPLFKKAADLLDKTFDRALKLGAVDDDGNPVPGQLILGIAQGETTAVNDLLGSLSKFVRDTRLANGLNNGVPTETPEEDDEPLIIEQRRLEPLKIAVGQDGRRLPQPSDDDDAK